jgi:peptide deformylase
MALRPIVKYGDPVLARPAEPVTRFDDGLKTLVADMIQTMYAAPGVGLAAPQVGVSLRLAVIDVSVGQNPDDLLVLVNPEILAAEGTQEVEEGCLSLPEFAEVVRRPAVVEVRAFDLDGREWVRKGDGLLARAFEHELDHLAGSLFVDRLKPLQRALLMRKVRKRLKAGGWDESA